MRTEPLELMLSNCGAGEDSESPLDSKEMKPVNPKGNQYSLERLTLKLKLQYSGHLLCVCVRRSVMSNSATPWTVAHQAPLSMELSRQEYWVVLPFPSPGDLRDTGIESRSPALHVSALLSEPPGKPVMQSP